MEENVAEVLQGLNLAVEVRSHEGQIIELSHFGDESLVLSDEG